MSHSTDDPNKHLRRWGNFLWWAGLVFLAILAIGLLNELVAGNPQNFDSITSAILGAVIVAGFPLIAGYFMRRKAGPNPAGAERSRKPLSTTRTVLAIIGAAIVILVGGLQLWLIGNYLLDRSLILFHPYPVIIFGSPFFVIGLLIWFFAIRVGRR